MKEQENSAGKINFSEDFYPKPLKGILEYRIFRNGKLEEEAREDNLIVNVGRTQMARMLAGDFTNRNVNRISFGTSGTAPALPDTSIAGQYTKAITGVEYPGTGQVRFNWTLATAEANGKAILEFGLLCADGVLFSRRIRESGKPINKESDISLEGSWTIIF
jgi:hypothetical protein